MSETQETTTERRAAIAELMSLHLEAAGLRDRTELRVVPGVPAAVLLAGKPWLASGTLTTKAVQGKSGSGKLLPVVPE